MNEEQKAAKKYLSRYGDYKKAIEKLELHLKYLQARTEYTPSAFDSPPVQSIPRGLEDRIVNYLDAKEQYLQLLFEQSCVFDSIFKKLAEMTDSTQSIVLMTLYLKALTEVETARETGISLSHIKYVKAQALQAFYDQFLRPPPRVQTDDQRRGPTD